MGGGTWTKSSWDSYTKTRGYSARSTATDLYKSSSVKDDFEPTKISIRESRDSVEHPNSTPIILCLDVTGSMSRVLETISKRLSDLITQIIERNPVTDPQVMFMAFGDVVCDDHPLQVTQFESDIRIAEQLNDIYFERGGGGNDGESYSLPWYFAARHTSTDNFEKRNKKGFLFTFGDEKCLPRISKEAIKKFVGDDIQADLTSEELLNEVSRKYEVYHLMIEEGSGMRWYHDETVDSWTNLLGQRAIKVSDVSKVPEIVVSILEVMVGKDKEEVIKSWDGSTSVVVQNAISGLQVIDESKELISFD